MFIQKELIPDMCVLKNVQIILKLIEKSFYPMNLVEE